MKITDVLSSMVLLSLLFVSCTPSDLDEKHLGKVQTLDGTIATLYEVISGPAGQKRNWDLFRYLFKHEAKLILSGKNKDGKIDSRFMSTADYIETSGQFLETNGFFEKEISRKVEQFSNMAHVFSTYEAYKKAEDAQPFMRGINSIQLLNDGNRWWILNIYWTNETSEISLPEKYLSLK